jgi:Flp pilus assembly protein TadD
MGEDAQPRGRPPSAALALSAAILVGAVLATFGRSLTFELVAWDDDRTIYFNPHIRALDAPSLWFMFTDAAYLRIYMPLSWVTLAVIHRFAGLDPRAYHLANLALHCANAVLVFLLIGRLLARSRERPRTATTVAALLGALLWAIHPLRTDVVCRASDIFHSQATLLTLTAALFYLRAAGGAPGSALRRPHFWLAVGAYAASLLTYPHALGAVLALIALEAVLRPGDPPLRPWPWSRTATLAAAEKAPFLAAMGFALAVNAWGRLQTTFFAPPVTLGQFGLPERIAQAFYVWAYYVWKPLVPLNLSPLYTPLMEFHPWDGVFLGSAALVLAISVLALRLRRRHPEFLAVWACHLALLLPFLGLTEHPHYTADRYSYLASVPWSVLLAVVLERALVSQRLRLRAAALAAACSVLAALAWRAHGQAAIWRNTATLYTHMLRELGGHASRAGVYLRLGAHFLNQGQHGEAIAWFDRTLEILPRDFPALSFKGQAQARAGDLDGAEETLRRALMERSDPRLHELRAAALLDLGRVSEAVAEIGKALALDPASVPPRVWLAGLLEERGRTAEAAAVLEEALRHQPNSVEIRQRLERIRSALGPRR